MYTVLNEKSDYFINHKNYNFLDCDWFKKLLFSIGQFVIGQFNKPIAFEVVV